MTFSANSFSTGLMACALGALAATALVSSALAQAAPPAGKPEMKENCPGLVASGMPRAMPAAMRVAGLEADQVRLSYIGHATFLIESPQGVRIATDYNDYVRPPVLPDIATMNHAHPTHYTLNPDPSIKYVLHGWGPDQQTPARHDLQYKDVHVRNVPTNIRDFRGGTERNGNSIFIFELANLCIGHLGHLHHTLTQAQLDEIGRLDVVMFPVDGSVTLDLDGMLEVLQGLKATVMIPMHAFSNFSRDAFLDRAKKFWPAEFAEVPTMVVSKATLPSSPKFVVLPGR